MRSIHTQVDLESDEPGMLGILLGRKSTHLNGTKCILPLHGLRIKSSIESSGWRRNKLADYTKLLNSRRESTIVCTLRCECCPCTLIVLNNHNDVALQTSVSC